MKIHYQKYGVEHVYDLQSWVDKVANTKYLMRATDESKQEELVELMKLGEDLPKYIVIPLMGLEFEFNPKNNDLGDLSNITYFIGDSYNFKGDSIRLKHRLLGKSKKDVEVSSYIEVCLVIGKSKEYLEISDSLYKQMRDILKIKTSDDIPVYLGVSNNDSAYNSKGLRFLESWVIQKVIPKITLAIDSYLINLKCLKSENIYLNYVGGSRYEMRRLCAYALDTKTAALQCSVSVEDNIYELKGSYDPIVIYSKDINKAYAIVESTKLSYESYCRLAGLILKTGSLIPIK